MIECILSIKPANSDRWRDINFPTDLLPSYERVRVTLCILETIYTGIKSDPIEAFVTEECQPEELFLRTTTINTDHGKIPYRIVETKPATLDFSKPTDLLHVHLEDLDP